MMMTTTASSIMVDAAKALAKILAEEHHVIDVFGGYFGSQTRSATGLGNDQVVELDDAGSDNDQCGDEHGPHHGDDNEEIGFPARYAIDSRRLPDVFVNASQAGQHQAHDKSGTLPQRCDENPVDNDVRVVEWIEGEVLETH